MALDSVRASSALIKPGYFLLDCVKRALERAEHPTMLNEVLWGLIENDLQRKKANWTPSILGLLTCELVGGDVRAAVPATAAWNLLHLAAHLFDELQDTGTVRSASVSLEPPVAMNAATALVFLARLALTAWPEGCEPPLLLQHELCRSLDWLGLNTCGGQHLDLTRAARPDFTLDDYWKLINAKAGEFFAWAAQAGARLGGGSPAQVALCKTYGYNLGCMLQIADDWVGLQSAEKPDDFATGKRTLAVLYALAVASDPDRERLLLSLAQARTHNQDREAVRRQLNRLGALQYVLVEARLRRQRALRALSELVAHPVRKSLEALVDQVFPIYDCKGPPETDLVAGLLADHSN